MFQVHSGIAQGLFHDRLEVLVVPMATIAGKTVGPLSREVTDG